MMPAEHFRIKSARIFSSAKTIDDSFPRKKTEVVTEFRNERLYVKKIADKKRIKTMNPKLTALIITVFLKASFAFSQTVLPHYRLSVQLMPESGMITGKVEIENPGDSVIYLSKGLKILSVTSDGKTIKVQKKAGSDTCSVAYSIKAFPQDLIVTYSGQIKPEDFPKTISNFNLMTSEVIELTDVIDWYPKIKGHSFTWAIQAETPSDFGLVTNGTVTKEVRSKRKRIIQAHSANPGYGISVLGSPELKKSIGQTNGYSVEIYYSKLPETYVDSMKADLLKTLQYCQDLYGSSGANHLVRIIYSPRPAGGYARGSIIVVSEKFALEQRSNKYGYARDFRLNAHEIAHFWSKANTSTPDDWINEGLAEFSALLASEKLIGKPFSGLLMSEYHGIVENTNTQTSIVETANDSWERETNRYYKPTLIFNEIRTKYGDESLGQLMRDLDSRFSEAHGATTELVLEVLEKSLGKEAKELVDEAIHRKVWNQKPSENNTVSKVDPIFIGKWSGPLTQFGTTTKFVVNIDIKDGIVVPTLDSPDQNAFGIPVSDFKQTDDSVSFKLGIASAVFTGTLDRNTQKIKGIWTQRGTDYPINLSKQ